MSRASNQIRASILLGIAAEEDWPEMPLPQGHLTEEQIKWLGAWLAGEGFAKVPAPTDSDEQGLIAAIGYDPVLLSIRDHPEITFEYHMITDRDGLIERILGAGFTKLDALMRRAKDADLNTHDWDRIEAVLREDITHLEKMLKVSSSSVHPKALKAIKRTLEKVERINLTGRHTPQGNKEKS